jgi:hypothetical protein
MLIDATLLSRGFAKRNDTNIVSPNDVNEGENDSVRLDEGNIPPPRFPATSLGEGNLVRIFVNDVRIVKVESMLPQIRFPFGLVPFVHGTMLLCGSWKLM